MASPFVPQTIPGAAGYPLGLTGAVAATRYVGATASGAPVSGTFAVGDYIIDQTGKAYVCTVAGSPGTWAAVSGASTTTVIETQTLSGTGNIDFQNIPATYTHLRIVGLLRGAQAANSEVLRLRFNNDSATVGTSGYLQSANTTLPATADAIGAYVMVGQIVGNSGAANRFAAVTIDIPDYANTSFHKAVTCVWQAGYTTTAASVLFGMGGGVWPVTSAISRILIWTANGAGQLLTGSTATLYGLSG